MRNNMKAPDKIFILYHKDYLDRRIFNAFTEKDNETDIEYIRKDALLEWAKKEMKEWSSKSNTAQGVKMGLTLVLDKIESL